MKDRKKKEAEFMEAAEVELAQMRGSKALSQLRRVNPLGMRVLVRLRAESNQTEGGLYLPEGAKQNMQESLLAEVVEVARAEDDHTEEDANISGVPQGALVLICKNVGIKVPWDESLRIVDTKDILAIVSEFSVS